MRKVAIQIIVLFFGTILFAQKPCEKDPKYNQFYFWIGEWIVYDLKGNIAGHSIILKILDNCVILEEWFSEGKQNAFAYSRKSYNSYNSASKQWQQKWVDNTGNSTEFLTGHFENDTLFYLSRPFPIDKNTEAIRKLTFFKLKDKVRQLGEISKDEGKNWTI